jgi:hypothetical protein
MRLKPIIAVSLSIGLWAAMPKSWAGGSGFDANTKAYLAQEDIIDPEAVEGDFEERVRVMQEWLRRREAERRHQNWGLDVVSPQEPSPSSDYFKDHGYDEHGFRRRDGNLRVKLRGLQDDSDQEPRKVRRHSTKGKARSRHR